MFLPNGAVLRGRATARFLEQNCFLSILLAHYDAQCLQEESCPVRIVAGSGALSNHVTTLIRRIWPHATQGSCPNRLKRQFPHHHNTTTPPYLDASMLRSLQPSLAVLLVGYLIGGAGGEERGGGQWSACRVKRYVTGLIGPSLCGEERYRTGNAIEYMEPACDYDALSIAYLASRTISLYH